MAFEERRVDEAQEWLDELLQYSDVGPYSRLPRRPGRDRVRGRGRLSPGLRAAVPLKGWQAPAFWSAKIYT